MKKYYVHHILVIAFVLLLSACNTTEIDTAVSDDLIEVPIHFSGEVSVSESPLTRAESSDDLYGIQVYQNGEPYAYGLFDVISNMSIYLHSGQNYSIIVQLIRNGKKALSLLTVNTGESCYKGTDGPYHANDGYSFYKDYSILSDICHFNSTVYSFAFNSRGFGFPFCLNSRYQYTGYYKFETRYAGSSYNYPRYVFNDRYKLPDKVYPVLNVTNHFVYDDVQTLCVSSSEIQADSPLNVDRYYGECYCAQVSSNINSLSIDMKHLVYGIQCNVTGVSDGTASITITNGNNTLFDKRDISGDFHSDTMIFAFSDMHAAYEYADNYTENITVSMKWMRGIGIEQDLGSQVLQVKRNANNVINIALDTN